MSYWYLASPYSKYPDGIHAAFELVSKQAALLIRHKIAVYAAISHTHPIAVHGELDPRDLSVWLPADEPLMRAAKGLIVCKMPTWEISYGISVEIKQFESDGKPIYYMTPGVVPPELIGGDDASH